jgi:hypothetical protein
MGLHHQTEKLGAPSLSLSGLQVWVHGRQFPNSDEPYDRDWLNVTVHCGATGSSVWVGGAILGSWSFDRFARECDTLYSSFEGIAVLGSDEPDLRVTVSIDRTGHVNMVVDITPDIISQQHRFHFSDLDQTYLPPVISQCRSILEAYPTPFQSPTADA